MEKEGGKIGPVIFYVTLGVVLIYFWWFLLYSHGVAPHH